MDVIEISVKSYRNIIYNSPFRSERKVLLDPRYRDISFSLFGCILALNSRLKLFHSTGTVPAI
jgi:hypothetical protein